MRVKTDADADAELHDKLGNALKLSMMQSGSPTHLLPIHPSQIGTLSKHYDATVAFDVDIGVVSCPTYLILQESDKSQIFY